MRAVPLFQRRSLAPSQLAKRKAGDEEEEEEEDRHPATVSEGPRGGEENARAPRRRGRPRPGGVEAGSALCDARSLCSHGQGDAVRGGGGAAAAQVSPWCLIWRLLSPPSSGD